MKLALAVVLALGSAIALNWGYVAQHRGASGLPPLSLRRPLAALRALFTNRGWVLGFVAGVVGWVLYVGALALAPLSIVQAASAGGIGVLALLVPERLARSEVAGVGVAILGLLLLAVSLGSSAGGHHASSSHVVLWVAASAGVAAVAAGTRGAIGLGAAAGVLDAAGDVATKAAVGGRYLFVPVLLAAYALGFFCLQLGFQRGRALTTIGVATLITNAVPIVAGIMIFGETAGALRIASFVLVVAGAVLLARTKADAESPQSSPLVGAR
ncbi:MAG TPA: hypothetical protein VGL76_06275 [Gaiellaceae bacterium]